MSPFSTINYPLLNQQLPDFGLHWVFATEHYLTAVIGQTLACFENFSPSESNSQICSLVWQKNNTSENYTISFTHSLSFSLLHSTCLSLKTVTCQMSAYQILVLKFWYSEPAFCSQEYQLLTQRVFICLECTQIFFLLYLSIALTTLYHLYLASQISWSWTRSCRNFFSLRKLIHKFTSLTSFSLTLIFAIG